MKHNLFLLLAILLGVAITSNGQVAAQPSPETAGDSNGTTAPSTVVPAGTTNNLAILKKPRPQYTKVGRRNVTEGVVRLRVVFLATGKIGSIDVVQALPDGLTEKAIEAARGINFRPKMVNGVPVNVTKVVEYSFRVYSDETDPDVRTPAKILQAPPLNLTPSEAAELKKNRVRVEIELDFDGKAGVSEFKSPVSDDLKKKILDAVSKIKFEPAKHVSGKNISVSRVIEYGL
jgi:TonB family protein